MVADMHRVRHLAWELPALGWDVEVLFPGAAFQRPEIIEPSSAQFFNPATPCHEVAPHDYWFFRPLKIRSIGWRAFRPLRDAGDALLRGRRFDLVYISTANFTLFCLGRRWARKFNVPYVLDYHDPWVRDRIDYATTKHRLKQRVGAALARWMEPYAVRGAAGVVSVSPAYLDDLRRRYASAKCLQAGYCAAIPFAGSDRDFAAPDPPTTDNTGAQREIIYVGAGGSIMAKSFAAICAALAAVRRSDPALVAALKVRLFGTYSHWQAGDPKPLQEIAAQYGLDDIVEELPSPITYRKSMELVQRSDGLLVLGVDNAGYVPSKLFTYALSGKPLLACFRSGTPPVRFFSEMPGLGTLLNFERNGGADIGEAIVATRGFLAQVNRRDTFNRRALIDAYLAPGMARRHAALFGKCTAAYSR